MIAPRPAARIAACIAAAGSFAPVAAPQSAAPADAPAPPQVTFAGPITGAALLPSVPAIVIARDEGLAAHPWSDLSRGSTEGAARLSAAGRRVFAWCVGPSDVVYVLADDDAPGLAVLRWDGRAEAPVEVLRDKDARLPGGVYALQFARDLDADGDDDFVIPRAAGLATWFGNGAASDAFRAGPVVRQELRVSVDLPDPRWAPGAIEQSIRIPRFDTADLNGDGHPDLAFRDQDLVQFFWSAQDGALPETPTFQLDLAEIRAELPAGDGDLIDVGNVLKALESQVSHVARDLNGDGAADLLLRQGRKVSLYRGGTGDAAGIDRSQAAQVLVTSGNLLAAFAVDDDQDGKEDLAMLRVADVSLGQALLWLAAGGTLSFDLFVYRQEGDLRFSRKPTSRRTLELELPSFASLLSQWEEDGEDILRGFIRVPAAGDFDGDGREDDVARLAEGSVEVFVDAASGMKPYGMYSRWKAVMDRFDRAAGGKDEVTVELRDFIDWAPLPGRELLEAVEGKPPTRTFALTRAGGASIDAEGREAAAFGEPVLFVVDVDQDGADDLIVCEASDDAAGNGALGPGTVRMTFLMQH